jgi:hypothetical protein
LGEWANRKEERHEKEDQEEIEGNIKHREDAGQVERGIGKKAEEAVWEGGLFLMTRGGLR